MKQGAVIICVDCHQAARHRARGRCCACYNNWLRHRPDTNTAPATYADWDMEAAKQAYDATPAASRSMAFWGAVALALGRTLHATYQHLHQLNLWPAKLSAQRETCPHTGVPMRRHGLCRSCYKQQLRRAKAAKDAL